MILIGFFCATCLTALAISLGGVEKLLVFWDTPSIILVVMTNAVLVFSSGKSSLFSRGMKEIFAMDPPQPEPNTEQIAAFFRYLSTGNIIGGIFWAIIGAILMLADLDPEKIGSGMAVCLLTNFYAMFLTIFVYLPLQARFQHPKISTESTEE